MIILRKIKEIYRAQHSHFLFVDYDLYKKWRWVIKLVVLMNPKYVSCEIFRKEYKIHTNFVVIGLRWNGKNVKRRVNGYAKEILDENPGIKCIYCEKNLTQKNATSDHVVPISKGGNNCQINIVVSCKYCNGERGNMPFVEYLKLKNPKYRKQKDIFI